MTNASWRSRSASGLARPPLLLMIVAGVMVAGAAYLLMQQQGQVQRLKTQLAASRQQVEELQAKNTELAKRLDGFQGERKTLEDHLASLRTQLAAAASDLEHSRKDLGTLQADYDQLSSEQDKLKVRLASANSERDEAKRELQRFQKDKTDLERMVGRLRERLTFLDRDYQQVAQKLASLETERNTTTDAFASVPSALADPAASAVRPAASGMPGTTVELPPIVVRKDQGGISGLVQARILEINASRNFLIVDKGSLDGVGTGTTFSLTHAGRPAGRATVVRVRPKLSACSITRTETGGMPQVGDIAVQSEQ